MEFTHLLTKINRLEIKTRGLTKELFSGQHQTAFKGRGMVFSEVRNYHFGDEVRAIDWNVTARYNEPYVKTFEEERELTIMLVLDVSGSQNFGTTVQTKKELALEIAAVLAFSATANNNKVGAIFITNKMERYIAPKKGKKHVFFLLKALNDFVPQSQETDINEGLKFLRNTQKKRCITFVVSDFKNSPNFIDGLKLTKKKHDTIAVQVNDPAEEKLPELGWIQLYNSENGQMNWVNSNSKKTQAAFRSANQKENQEIVSAFKKYGIDSVCCFTDQDVVRPLVTLFNRR
jgi:uncharacterized protein (DUF58 family)